MKLFFVQISRLSKLNAVVAADDDAAALVIDVVVAVYNVHLIRKAFNLNAS